jgi:hypothetical protein
VLTILVPQDGDVCGPTFSVAGSLDAPDNTSVRASVSRIGNGPIDAAVADEGWSADGFTRIPSPIAYTASATGDNLSAQNVSFKVQLNPVVGIDSMDVGDEPEAPVAPPDQDPNTRPKRVTLIVRDNSDLGACITAVLIAGRGGVVYRDPDIQSLGNRQWKVVFRNVDPGVYAARVTWHINDRKVSTSTLVRAR